MSDIWILVSLLGGILGALIVGFNELHKAIKGKGVHSDTTSLMDIKLVLEDILQAIETNKGG